MALRWLPLLAAAALAGCAAPRAPQTQVMGAGPACDLRIDVGADHRCAVQHVTPPDPQDRLTGSMRAFEAQELSPSALPHR
jgi:hypothetical protein